MSQILGNLFHIYKNFTVERKGTLVSYTLPIHGIWQSYMYALDMSIGKQNVLGIRKGPNKKFVQDITFCYEIVLQTCQ
jgi:hypothetical protein